MFPHRPRHAIYCPSRGPPFGLFPRHRRYSQRENGTTAYTRECLFVSSLRTPNLHRVATTWPCTSECALHATWARVLLILRLLTPPESESGQAEAEKLECRRFGDGDAASLFGEVGSVLKSDGDGGIDPEVDGG